MKISLVVSAFYVIMLAVEAVNIKRVYCDNQEFVGNLPSRYPHLHCGKSFLTLSRTGSNHLNMQGQCNVVDRVLSDWEFYYGRARDPQAITNVLNHYQGDRCPIMLDVV